MSPKSVQLTLGPLQVTPVDRTASIACRADVNPLDLSAMLRDAVESSGCQHKEAALSVGYQPDYWTRALNGERGVHLDKFGKLPERVQRAFVTRWALQLRLRVTEGDAQKHAAANLLQAAAAFLAETA